VCNKDTDIEELYSAYILHLFSWLPGTTTVRHQSEVSTRQIGTK